MDLTHIEEKVTDYKALLESTNAIPWRVDWTTKTFTYVGPQIEVLLGWPRSSWVTIEHWAQRIHPSDREVIVQFCSTQSQLGLDHEAVYRAVRQDASHLWVRDIVHVDRTATGVTNFLSGFMMAILDQSSMNKLQIITKTNPFNEAQILRIGLKITRAELKIANALLQGQKLSEYSTLNNISINTARAHIRSLFDKFGVNRQVDLIRKLLDYGV